MLASLDELGTIAAVARSLHLTAPGVSMQLAALEREVGLQLTEKHGRTVALTPAGELLARHGREIVDRLSIAGMEVDALRDGAAGTYRLAAFPSAARTIVAHTWVTLHADPAIGLTLRLRELEPEQAINALTAGEVDIALVHHYSNLAAISTTATRLKNVPVASEPVWLAVRHDDPLVNGGGPVDLRHFSGHTWITPGQQWSCHRMVQRACGLAGFEPNVVAEATDFAVQLALVSAGAGVALVPQLTVAQLPESVRLLQLVSPVHRHISVLTRAASEADAGIHRLRDLLADSAVAALARPIAASAPTP
ncbi:MAG: hypothetical protein JWQ43_2792 [Glaciihabitans sp.]|nr:hypothetical protein [Glaciihabitans sp.]